ncbi:hypothetical protein [Negadavirga shengliensis]|uniref:Carboxypeptidase-like regulatory domain-containing protein n=1 Tax=Negadavirga shengliensis TaxID=1389218 RepID=A0ABV9T0K1_9BACT
MSQQKLQTEFQFANPGEMSIREALEQASDAHDFYFSYQSSLVEVDKPLPLDHYNGTIAGFLAEALGEQYEFREIPGYIIIRYAPGVLDLEAEMETGSRQVTVKGHVKDLRTQKNLGYATVYERNTLTSTLTDQNGYFELKLRQSNPSIWLTLGKENYRDTTFMLLPQVDIQAKRGNGRFRYYPDDGSAEEMEQSFFGRMFIGVRQRFQRLNLGGFFAENPYQMSFIPGLSSQGMFSSQMINKFSLNLLGGYTAGVDGFEAAGIFNINQRDVRYFQMAGIFNMVGGEVNGFQVAGIFNSVYKNVSGFQVAGLHNHTRGRARGLQVAGLYNRTDSTANHQIAGLINKAKGTTGFQIAGLANLARNHANGLQLAGLFNHTKGTAHHQMAGLFNKAGHVKGSQFGLVNIAESSDNPIGLVNFVKNGKKSLALGTDESRFAHLTLRSGGRKFYGLLGTAYFPGQTEAPLALEAGFGLHLLETRAYTMDLELVIRVATDFRNVSNHTNSFKYLHGFNMGKNTRLFAGPTFNFTVLDPGQDISVPGMVFYERTNRHGTYGLYGGFIAGIQYVF